MIKNLETTKTEKKIDYWAILLTPQNTKYTNYNHKSDF